MQANHILEKFMCSVVYAFNYEGARQSLWDEIVTIKNSNSLPWIFCGDFNCVKFSHKKTTNNHPSPIEMKDFNKCLLEAELQDLKW